VIDGILQLKHAFTVESYVGRSCVLNRFMLSSLSCFSAYADLLSLQLVTFLKLFGLVHLYRLLPALDHACSSKYDDEELDSSM